MANRCYLYSTDLVPGEKVAAEERTIVGISECPSRIPIVYKILLSGNPRKCSSLIWEASDELALIGDYEEGLRQLMRFLDQITNPALAFEKERTIRFLSSPGNRNPYFVLEPTEIFMLGDDPAHSQCDRLLEQIQNLEGEVTEALAGTRLTQKVPSKRKSFLRNLFGVGAVDSLVEPLDPGLLGYSLGLGYWSTDLYYDFGSARRGRN